MYDFCNKLKWPSACVGVLGPAWVGVLHPARVGVLHQHMNM
jgi:hypothetical protein